jgi:hypothetical protein
MLMRLRWMLYALLVEAAIVLAYPHLVDRGPEYPLPAAVVGLLALSLALWNGVLLSADVIDVVDQRLRSRRLRTPR